MGGTKRNQEESSQVFAGTQHTHTFKYLIVARDVCEQQLNLVGNNRLFVQHHPVDINGSRRSLCYL
jgi:hypothetical protein